MFDALLGQGVAGQGVLQLGHRPDIAGVQFRHRLQGFPLRAADVRQALRRRCG